MGTNPNNKRKFDTVDLTEDDDAPSSQSRRAPPGENLTQSQRDTWLEQGSEDDADEVVVLSQDGDGNNAATLSYQLYSTYLSKASAN